MGISWARWRHRRWQDQLSAYLDGALSARARRQVEAHLAVCQACQQGLAQLQATVQVLRALPPMAVPRSFALPAGVAAAGPPNPLATRAYRASRVAAAGVAVALALVITLDLLGVATREEGGGAPTTQLAAPATTAMAPLPKGTPAPATADQAESQARQAAPAATPSPAAPGAAEEAPKATVAAPPQPAVTPAPKAASGGEAPLRGAEIGLAVMLVVLVGSAVTLRRRPKAM